MNKIDLEYLINKLPLEVDSHYLRICREDVSWYVAYNTDYGKEIWEEANSLSEAVGKMLKRLNIK